MRESVLPKTNYKFFMAYYVLLLIALILLMRPGVTYPLWARLVFLGIIVIPLFFCPRFIPSVVVCFWGVCSNSFYALLPDNFIYLVAVVFSFLFFNYRMIKKTTIAPWNCALLFLYTFIISLLFSDTGQNFLIVLLLFILIYPFLRNQADVFNLSISICVMSAALAVIYFLNFRYFMVNVGQTDFEVGAWGNKNVLAGAVSCGIPISLALLMGLIKGRRSLILNSILITGMVLMSAVLFSAGSRGSLVAASVSSLFVLFSVKGNLKRKVITVGILTALLYLLYRQGAMDFLIYRLTELNTNETAGNRTIIWTTKLNAFFSTDGLTMLFGMGRDNCDNFAIYYSTHNDFVTALVGFGFCGVIIFTLYLLKPLFLAKKEFFFPIFALWIFIFLESLVLEPFFRGYIPFYAFYVLLLKQATLLRNEK